MPISGTDQNVSAAVHTVTTPTHGRYLVTPSDQPGPAPMLVGFHGYGEHAERHLTELNRIPGAAAWLRVAIQGLHRFYSNSGQHVVASWMTRQDRELAIADNLAYINEVVRTVKATYDVADTLVYCGFSQGVAMAYRAGARGDHACRGIVALAGDVPPELKDDPTIIWPPVLIGRGETDEWYSRTKMDADLAFFDSIDGTIESLVFEAGHEWTDDFRERAGSFLARVHR